MLVGKQKIAKDVKIASIEMDWKTGALLTQFFQEEQVGHASLVSTIIC